MPSRASAAAALIAAGATALAGTLAVPPVHAAKAARATGTTSGDVTVVQANIKSALTPERFQADVRKVLAGAPDFVTYNEVPLRQDWILAPEGYELHRTERNRYTKATAVAWRSDRWTAVDSGTFRISNYRKVPPRRNIKLGLRFANWVTLQSEDGRLVSVVAAHVAPLDKNMPDLLRRSVKRIRRLTGQLAEHGPVLVGGDFNVHYKSGRYPRDLLTPADLVPSYDTLDSYFPTGDHHGATIDYVFARGEGMVGATEHYPMELRSDHDAVVVGLDWQADPPLQTRRLVSDPTGDTEAKRRAVKALVDTISGTTPGQELEVVGAALTLRPVFRRLKGAIDRGVHVRLTTRSEPTTRRERRLNRVASASVDTNSAVRRCRSSCLRSWRDSAMPRGFVLVRDDTGAAVTRVDLNRVLNSSMLDRRTKVLVHTGSVRLAEGEDLLASVY